MSGAEIGAERADAFQNTVEMSAEREVAEQEQTCAVDLHGISIMGFTLTLDQIS